MTDSYRIERDTMGEMRVPADVLYGAQTARAIENFPISGKRFPRSFIRALGLIKSAAAKVNGRPDIVAAAEAVVEGRHDGQFAIDIFQTGSGSPSAVNACM
jgi:fumarate hydratase, class II